MQQTEKLKLNLIDRDDPFTPDALNENTKQMEKVLEARAICFGTYEGTGVAGYEVELGFSPRLLLIFGYYTNVKTALQIIDREGGFIINGNGVSNGTAVSITETGFRLNDGAVHNVVGTTMRYIAFP